MNKLIYFKQVIKNLRGKQGALVGTLHDIFMSKWLLVVSLILLLGAIVALMLQNNYGLKQQNFHARSAHKRSVIPRILPDMLAPISVIAAIHESDFAAPTPAKPLHDVVAEIPAVMLNNEPTEQEKQQAMDAALVEYQSQMRNVAVVDKVIVLPDMSDFAKNNKKPNIHTQNTIIKHHHKAKNTVKKSQATATVLNRTSRIKKDGYTLQLLGSHNEQALRDFINTHKIASQSSYFKTQLNEKVWYVLVYGHYASKNKALIAIAALPQEIRQLQPWPRSYADINTARHHS